VFHFQRGCTKLPPNERKISHDRLVKALARSGKRFFTIRLRDASRRKPFGVQNEHVLASIRNQHRVAVGDGVNRFFQLPCFFCLIDLNDTHKELVRERLPYLGINLRAYERIDDRLTHEKGIHHSVVVDQTEPAAFIRLIFELPYTQNIHVLKKLFYERYVLVDVSRKYTVCISGAHVVYGILDLCLPFLLFPAENTPEHARPPTSILS
jgi:hypothetical protein